MQDISFFCYGQKVDKSSGLQDPAEIKAADPVPVTPDRRLCILGRDVWAVLTGSLLPVAPIQQIEDAPRAGPGAFAQVVSPGLRLSLLRDLTNFEARPSGPNSCQPKQIRREKERRVYLDSM